ncbi:hypothetical protein [Paenibacillus donghaensis]|uniref:hypothetical protein n=1 Tax=Paenibacillus donghaensis TaxID=414771 RepID=UPI0012FD2A53|nr:hypothetical protein [Paenibacillus donghaensis]
MGIVDQMKEILNLLEKARFDLSEWIAVDYLKNEYPEYIEETTKLISDIESIQHEVGA